MTRFYAKAAALAGPALLLLAPGPVQAADAPPLTGMWGAGDATLALDAQGGRLQTGCLFARIAPIRPNASGQFSATAQVERLSAMLPEDDAAEASATPARLTGRLGGGMIDITLTVEGQAPRRLQLAAGQRGRPARCL